MREKERLKMGGKEEKRGGCRGESLIIYRPVSHFRSTTKPHKTVWKRQRCGADEKDGQKCGDGEVEQLVEKGYMTTPMAWIRIRKVEKARGATQKPYK